MTTISAFDNNRCRLGFLEEETEPRQALGVSLGTCAEFMGSLVIHA